MFPNYISTVKPATLPGVSIHRQGGCKIRNVALHHAWTIGHRLPAVTCRRCASWCRISPRRYAPQRSMRHYVKHLWKLCCRCRTSWSVWYCSSAESVASASLLSIRISNHLHIYNYRSNASARLLLQSGTNALHKSRISWQTRHTGLCRTCADDLGRKATDELLHGVSLFGARNTQDPLAGFPSMDVDSLTQLEYQHLFRQATVLEAMLVALNHMQVSVCEFTGRQDRRTGITRFRKNIISFPQHVSELQQHLSFVAGVMENDIVNVFWDSAAAGMTVEHPRLRRARVVEKRPDAFVVRFTADEPAVTVRPHSLRSRFNCRGAHLTCDIRSLSCADDVDLRISMSRIFAFGVTLSWHCCSVSRDLASGAHIEALSRCTCTTPNLTGCHAQSWKLCCQKTVSRVLWRSTISMKRMLAKVSRRTRSSSGSGKAATTAKSPSRSFVCSQRSPVAKQCFARRLLRSIVGRLQPNT